jgi:DNA segregation ATPase FtsK/SpoIIIE, S-DNA-T family
MSDQRQWHLDLVACLLLVAGLGVCLAVLGYDPAGSTNVYPPTDGPPHLLGPVGNWVGRVMLETLGVSVYVLLASWFVLVLLIFLRRRFLTWTIRLAGWLLLIPTTAILAHSWGSWLSPNILPGPGGSLGAYLAFLLQTHCRPMIRTAILAGSLAIGLLLTSHFILFRLVRWTWQALGWTMAQVGRMGRLPVPNPPRRGLPRPVKPAKTPAVKPQPAAEQTVPTVPEPSEPSHLPQGEPVVDRTIPIHHHASLELPSDSAGLPATAASVVRSPAPKSEAERFADYELPPLTLLEDNKPSSNGSQEKQLRERAALLEKTFADFDINVRVVGINTGPVVTQFEIALETGLRVHKVTRLGDDVALNLRVSGVRIVAPIPGKNTVGIEIPNETRDDVRLKEVILASSKKIAKAKLPLFLGKDSEGRPLVYDLADMPHLLIAGSTGTGKSVCMNAIILSILMTRRPDEVKMVMIDPKMAEMSEYGRVPHLMHPVVTDMKKAEAILGWAVEKMEDRYELLSRARVRNIAAYNALKVDERYERIGPLDEEDRKQIPIHIPYIVILIDEMADLMLQMKKEVEGHIIRLAQKSRASGIHLVVATQRPTVDVVTGLIKSNLPARVCFKVVSKSDSRVVLDAMGADKLLGRGDMLLLPPGTSDLVRAQGTYASNEEIEQVVAFIESDPCYAPELMQLKTRDAEEDGPVDLDGLKARDDLYESAIEIIVREGRGSVSLLQRALGIGYGRAARLVDYMAEDGIVGVYNGSSAREVLLTPDEWQAMRSRIQGGEPSARD